MKKISRYMLLVCFALNGSFLSATPTMRYHDKMELARDIIDAVLTNNALKLESITQSLVIPYTEYQNVIFPLYKEDSSATLQSFPKNEVYPTNWFIKDSNNYNHFIANFYFSECISKLLNDADNLNPYGKNIYIAFDKVDDSISPLVSKNYLGILYETDDYVKIINMEALITYKNTIYAMRQTNYHSYKKDVLPSFLLKKFPENIVTYKYLNNKFINYIKDTLQFKNVDYREYSNEPHFIESNEIQVETITQEGDTPKEPEIYDRAIEMPQFPGGVATMMNFIRKTMIYPKVAKENSLEGKVIIKFYVDTDGSIQDPVVLKDAVGGGCADEALRIVKKMPKWKPGSDNGRPVKVYYTIPIQFKL